MAYILETLTVSESDPKWPNTIRAAWKRYYEYLDSVKLALPRSAYEFARADWHYSATDPRSLHDAWLVTFALVENPEANSRSKRSVDARITLLGPNHDRHIHLLYGQVQSYTVMASHEGISSGNVRDGHGDWLLDEVRLSRNGGVIHEIAFRSGARWLLECQDIRHSEQLLVPGKN